MDRPAANLTEAPGRCAVTVTPDRILYSDGTTTLWRPSGPVTFPSTRRLTRNRHGARWIVYATGWGRCMVRRADCQPPGGIAVPVLTYRAAAGTLAGTLSAEALARFRSLDIRFQEAAS
jgi:hypothetical protein